MREKIRWQARRQRDTDTHSSSSARTFLIIASRCPYELLTPSHHFPEAPRGACLHPNPRNISPRNICWLTEELRFPQEIGFFSKCFRSLGWLPHLHESRKFFSVMHLKINHFILERVGWLHSPPYVLRHVWSFPIWGKKCLEMGGRQY